MERKNEHKLYYIGYKLQERNLIILTALFIMRMELVEG